MNIPENIGNMLKMLADAGFSAYLVGGCVRDAFMGTQPHDFDIATNALPEQIMAVFGEKNCTAYGRAFGTVGVKHGGGFAEITTYRRESDYTDCRHPAKVEFADTILEDLARRDFTCNAMAFSLETGIYDPFGGRADIEAGVLRCVGTAEARFHEDALRILRGLRFCARFGFVPDKMTDAAMRAGAFRLEMISAERVLTELMGLLMGEHVTKVLLEYPRVLAVRIPEILPCIAFCQHTRHHAYTVWEHTARAVGVAQKHPAVRLAMLMHDLGKPQTFTRDARGGHFKGHAEKSADLADQILRRLRCENHLRELVVKLIRLHRGIPRKLADVQRLLGELEYDEFSLLLGVLRADNLSKLPEGEDARAAAKIAAAQEFARRCREEQLCCRVRDLAVRGGDLAALGLQGEVIGLALHFLLDAVISGQCRNEKDYSLEYLRKNLKNLGIAQEK